VLLVGIDGASPRLVEPLLAAGRLPNLARIAREGVWGRLQSHLPLASPLVWNTIATGKHPAKHGIRSFVRREGDHLELLLSTDRRVHALWNIASDAGLRVGVVNFWNTYPPERIDGVMVSDHLLPSEVAGRRTVAKAGAPPPGPLVFPESWQTRVAQALGPGEPVVDVADPFAHATGLPPWVSAGKPPAVAGERPLSLRFREDTAYARIALAIEAAIHPDLLMLLLPGIDRVSHVIWAGVEPPERYPPHLRPSPAEHAALAAALEAYYAYTDALIGALVARFGPEDLVLVVSDHGFEAGVDFGFLTGVHHGEAAAQGVLFARGRGIEGGGAAGQVAVEDVTPTVLAWLGLPVGEDMDGRVAGFLAAPDLAQIPTHDTMPVERLRDLGYLDTGAGAELE
jgi:predicted AlkP superfamily phosphohydrolase/phosphomutase